MTDQATTERQYQGHIFRADKVQVGDVVLGGPTSRAYGTVVQVDTFDLNSGNQLSASGYPWPCLRILIDNYGGIARFPSELIEVSRATRVVTTTEDGDPAGPPECACCEPA